MYSAQLRRQEVSAPSARAMPPTGCTCGGKRNEAWQSLAVRRNGLNSTHASMDELDRDVSAAQGSCCAGNKPGSARQVDNESSVPELSEEERMRQEFHRQHQCANQPDPTKPKTKPFTSRERSRALFGLQNARSIASRASSNLAQRDPYYLRKAEKTFQTTVSFDLLDEHVRRIKSELEGLVLDQNVVAATCDEEQCNDGQHNFVGVTKNDLSGILLCPFYFLQPGRTLATTYIHEAGHMANIDVNWAPGNERYCRGDDVIECGNPCPLSGENLVENVDAWMRLIYCIAMSH